MKHVKTQTITLTLVIALVVALGAVIVLRGYVNNQLDQVNELRRTIADSDEEIDVVSLKRKIGELRAVRDEMDDYFIDQARNIEFIEGIETLGDQFNLDLQVQNITAEDVTAGRRSINDEGVQSIVQERIYGFITMQVTAIGSWTDVMKLLLVFENYPQYLDVVTMRLAPVRRGELGTLWSVTFSLKGVTN